MARGCDRGVRVRLAVARNAVRRLRPRRDRLGIVYVLSYFPFGVSAEFRYGYWCVLASLAGAVAVLAGRRLNPPKS